MKKTILRSFYCLLALSLAGCASISNDEMYEQISYCQERGMHANITWNLWTHTPRKVVCQPKEMFECRPIKIRRGAAG